MYHLRNTILVLITVSIWRARWDSSLSQEIHTISGTTA